MSYRPRTLCRCGCERPVYGGACARSRRFQKTLDAVLEGKTAISRSLIYQAMEEAYRMGRNAESGARYRAKRAA